VVDTLRGARLGIAAAALAAALPAPPAAALEFFEGRLQVHGFYEAQVRSIVRDYDFSDDWDLTQWYNVLNLEFEADLAPEGLGPFQVVSVFSRVEARYDCVWTHACTLFDSAATYGHRARKLPKRLIDGERTGFNGTMATGNTNHFYTPIVGLGSLPPRELSRKPLRVFQNPAYTQQFGIPGLDQLLGSPDDPARFVMSRFDDCTYGAQATGAPTNGKGVRTLLLGIDGCDVEALGSLRGVPNPFRGLGSPNPPGTTARTLDGRVVQVPEGDFNPVLFDPSSDPNDPADVAEALGTNSLPYRPAPVYASADPNAPKAEAQGLFYPNEGLADLMRDGALADEENFRESELAWNRGASQQQTKELKELYVDLEAFEGRLWVRAGRQNIVWGKTELFRTTDQFNPQDLALASLPGLEESRIPLWSLRGSWSFYDVGPLEDVRLELAANYDEFTPADLGRGGEPYTLDIVSAGWFGFEVHGVLGLGLAGVRLPPDAWESWQGIEAGARLEWRWDRFSFALTDFYGYSDTPYVEHVFRYSRNVDPLTGRPREATRAGRCDPGGLTGPPDSSGCLEADRALAHHSANQQLFAWICSMTVGATELDPAACGNSVFNSQTVLLPPLTLASITANLLVGNPGANALVAQGQIGIPRIPSLPLNVDFCDGFLEDCATPGPPPNPSFALRGPTMNTSLTVQQQALFGCGEFYGTDCESQGFDLLNAEANVLLQSWPGFEGTFGTWDTTDPNVAQPGTVGFEGGPVCTRYEGAPFILPGCRGPGPDGVAFTADDDPGYDPNVDGSPTDLVHPFFDPSSPDFQGTLSALSQRFRNELGAASFNLLMFLTAASRNPLNDPNPTLREFDVDDQFRTDGCSFARPQLCYGVQGFLDFTGVQRNEVRAGGSDRFGRRDFVWAMGAPLVARFEKRNVLGFSSDWAEDLTKSNWSVEATWIEGVPFFDNDERDGLRTVDTYNLTVSADRPTFVNFLNANRTFFVNSQWFFQFIDGYKTSFPGTGPWNVFFTLTVQTGYFQDRLNPSLTSVYDFRSASGALLPQITYRFTENFSATFGLAAFYGREQFRNTAMTQVGPANRVGTHAYKDAVENGLSLLRSRDEAYLMVRYTF
jgi:hypothetical protein